MPAGRGVRVVAQVERELAFEDEEGVRVLSMDVQWRTTLARPVVELGDRDLRVVDEHGGPPLWAVRDVLALCSSCPTEDDESGIGRDGVRRRPLVESGHIATNVVAVPRARCVEGEEPRRCDAGHLDRVHDLGWDVCPALRADPMHTILELECELPFEDVQRLAVPGMDVGRCLPPARRGAHCDRGELLDVREERHVEFRAPEDDLAFVDLDHLPAA